MNRRIICLTVMLLCSMGVYAIAGTKIPYDSSRPAVPIQNVTGMAPLKAKSGCITQATTKTPFGTYTSLSDYMQYEAEVVDSAGAAVSVKWKLDGTQVATGSSFKMVNERGNTYSRAVAQPYSTASRSLTLCGRRR